jgi:hypothetical protein
LAAPRVLSLPATEKQEEKPANDSREPGAAKAKEIVTRRWTEQRWLIDNGARRAAPVISLLSGS